MTDYYHPGNVSVHEQETYWLAVFDQLPKPFGIIELYCQKDETELPYDLIIEWHDDVNDCTGRVSDSASNLEGDMRRVMRECCLEAPIGIDQLQLLVDALADATNYDPD